VTREVRDDRTWWPGGVHPDREALARAHEDAEDVLTEALDRWAEKYPDVVVHRAVRHGLDVPVALGAASRTAQLTVVGSSHSARSSMGSVAQALVRRAGCPVAVVPIPWSR
jgi:nucleotide-binding universal stress UspA family protein